MNKEEIDNLLEEKSDSGEKISPVLPDGIKNYLIDIDGKKDLAELVQAFSFSSFDP